MPRILKYREAISEALVDAMECDPSIFITGIGVDYSSGIFGTTTEALKRFPDRVFESPAMENALTGIAIGAAAMGMRPVIVHARNDFMFLAMDQLINLASKWKYMFGGNAGSVPIVVRAIVGRGWGQGATHSQSLHSVLGHFPGLRVVMPATPADAKYLTLEALANDGPTVILEHRSLYETEGDIENAGYVPWIMGADATIIAVSHSVTDANAAALLLYNSGITVSVVPWLLIRPIYSDVALAMARHTGRLVITDTSWGPYGVSAEIAALVAEKVELKAPIVRVTLPDCPAAAAHSLEQQFYPGVTDIVRAVCKVMGRPMIETDPDKPSSFTGPY